LFHQRRVHIFSSSFNTNYEICIVDDEMGFLDFDVKRVCFRVRNTFLKPATRRNP